MVPNEVKKAGWQNSNQTYYQEWSLHPLIRPQFSEFKFPLSLLGTDSYIEVALIKAHGDKPTHVEGKSNHKPHTINGLS